MKEDTEKALKEKDEETRKLQEHIDKTRVDLEAVTSRYDERKRTDDEMGVQEQALREMEQARDAEQPQQTGLTACSRPIAVPPLPKGKPFRSELTSSSRTIAVVNAGVSGKPPQPRLRHLLCYFLSLGSCHFSHSLLSRKDCMVLYAYMKVSDCKIYLAPR